MGAGGHRVAVGELDDVNRAVRIQRREDGGQPVSATHGEHLPVADGRQASDLSAFWTHIHARMNNLAAHYCANAQIVLRCAP